MESRTSPGEYLHNPFSPSTRPAPPCRTSQCRPLSVKPTIAGVKPLDELNVPRSCLPLILHCTICLRTSTWYNPMHPKSMQSPPLDILPSLSISSHSTSSEPSSIGTEFFSSMVVSPSTDHLCAARVTELATVVSDGSDDHTPVTMLEKSAVSDRQASSRIKSWIGGRIQGVCSSCHQSSLTDAPEAPTNLELSQSHINDPEMVLSEPDSDSQPLKPVLQCPTDGFVTTLPQHPLVASSTLVKTSTKVPFAHEADRLSSRSDVVTSAVASPTSSPSIHFFERTAVSCDDHVLPNLPLKTNSPGLESVKRSPSTKTRKKVLPTLVQDLQTTTMSMDLLNKCEVAASDSGNPLRHEVSHRGTTLRALLREAKIPHADSDILNNSSRRHPTTVEKWQAAMIATPRDHLRPGDLPTWQLHGAADSPFYHHLCGLPASSGSLSGKETSFSASVTSLRNSPYEDSRSCNSTSEQLTQTEVALLNRRPSHGRQKTIDKVVNHTTSEFPPPSSDDPSVPSSNEAQEILTGSALVKATRHSPSSISLMARLANIHPNVSKVGRSSKRRPNTATGTTQSASIPQPSPKPGSRGRSTPCPNAAGPSLLPSLFLAGSKAISAESRATNANAYKRPATATCSGTRSELSLSISKEPLTRPIPIQRPATGKNYTAFVPSLATIEGRAPCNDTSDAMGDRRQISSSLCELDDRLYPKLPRDPLLPAMLLPVSASPQSSVNSRQGSPVHMSQSVPNFLLTTRFLTPKRNAFCATVPLSVTSDQLLDADLKDIDFASSPWLQHEEFQSKSRNFTLSVLPRPTVATFSPGQKFSANLKLSNKAKVKKYTSIYLLLIGNITCDNPPHSPTHNFLRHNYLVYPHHSDGVTIVSNSGDLSEWHLELNLPEYANCSCTPGPLPLPSTGTHHAGTVSYSLQLIADRKQLLSNQESFSVNMNVMARAEARYQVTTRCLRTVARKGRIPFAGGYLGSIDELSLSHQVYYQSSERLRIGYQFELQLSSHFLLPSSVAEEVSRATIIQVNTLMRLQPNEYVLKFTDHRSKVAVIPPDDKGGVVKWIIKGFLELKAVSQQMKAMKAILDGTPRTPRRPENTMGSRSMLSSSHGNNSLSGGVTSSLGSSTNNSLQQETERQAKFNSSQLFLVATIDHCPGVLTKPAEISSLIGPELLSPCSLRKLGEQMMKKAVMAEKMKRVQEENFKNNE